MDMLKRKNIVVEDWQNEYIEAICKMHDLSYSQAVRNMISIACCAIRKQESKEFKQMYSKTRKCCIDLICELNDKQRKGILTAEESHAILSKIMFEGRTAWEYAKEEIGKTT